MPASHWLKAASRTLLVLAGTALALTIVIVATGGFAIDLGVARLSARTARNPLNVAWLALLIGVLCRTPFRVAFVRRSAPVPGVFAHVGAALLAGAILLGPLLVGLGSVLVGGEYSSPRVLWRSSPPGGDLLTLLLGHPAHLVTGSWTLWVHQRLGIDPIEQTLWLGLMPLLLLVAWRRSWLQDTVARRWLAVGVVFWILALGPFLRVGGVDTGLTLPQAGVRYIPGISNARMPGRAAVVVQLAAAVLLAMAWRRRQPGTRMTTVLVALVILDSLPGRLPLYELPAADAVDRELAANPAGAVLELPTGLRDGSGDSGTFDHRALVHQFAHGRPLAGGFVARLSPRTVTGYREDPVLDRIVAFSRGDTDTFPSAAELSESGFADLVINRDLLDEGQLPGELLAAAGYRYRMADGRRELFSIPR